MIALVAAGCQRDPQPVATQTATASGPASPAKAPATASARASAEAEPPPEPRDAFVENALRASGAEGVDDWLERADALRLQVLVSVVKPGAKGPSDLEEHGFRVDAEYFYPASAIKTLLAVGALRYLDELAESHDVELPPNVRIMRCEAPAGHCEVPEVDEDDDPDDDYDEEKPNLSREIRKLLAWSDNDSYDRLYDLVGHQRLNELMVDLGLSSARFHHRMSSSAAPEKTLRVRVFPWKGKVITLPARSSELRLAATPAAGLTVGTAHKTGKGLVEEPMSFAHKNYASLRDLHRLHVALVRPELSELDLKLSPEALEVVVDAMTGRPVAGKHGAVHKPMLPGVLEAVALEGLRYTNKSGRAYGFHLENAYLEHGERGGAFFVTAVIYANPNGVLNDDDYAYEELSQPFLEALSQGLAREILAPAQ